MAGWRRTKLCITRKLRHRQTAALRSAIFDSRDGVGPILAPSCGFTGVISNPGSCSLSAPALVVTSGFLIVIAFGVSLSRP